MSIVSSIKNLLGKKTLTQREIDELEKNQQAAARARGQEIFAVLSRVATADCGIPEEIMESENYRELAEALAITLHDAPVLRLNVEEIDKALKHIADCFLYAIIKGDEKTAKLAISALAKGIIDIRQDVDEANVNVQETIEASKLEVMNRMERMVDISKDRFNVATKIYSTQAELNATTARIQELEAEVNKINEQYPERFIEIDHFVGGKLSEEAMALKLKIDEIMNLDKAREKKYSDGLELRKVEGDLSNAIEQIKSQLAFEELTIDYAMSEELKDFAKQYQEHYMRIMKAEEELRHTIDANWNLILEATNDPNASENASATAIFWKEREMKQRAELKAKIAKLKEQQNGTEDISMAGERMRLEAELKQLEENVNKNTNRNRILNAN